MATTRTVFLNSNLSQLSTLAEQYDSAVFEIVMLDGGSAQVQAYLASHAGASITVVSPSSASDGLFTPRVVFIDPSVDNYQALVAGMPAGCTIVVLDAARDGIQQMRDYLANNAGQVGAIDIVTGIASLDVVSHGAPGEIVLGSTVLNASTLAQYASQLAEIGSHMTGSGDILLYGCDVAAGAEGQAFIAGLAQATGADIAASTDLTGSAAAGGDWVLEASAGGTIEAATLAVADVDVLLPVTSASITAIDNDSGTGPGATDFVTNDTTLTFSGKYTSNNGSTDMYLWVDGKNSGKVNVQPNKDNVDWSFTHAAALTTGAHTIILNTNQNNATSGELARRTVTIDTSTLTPNVALVSDTGIAGDGITRVGSLSVTGFESGAEIDYSNNGGTFTSGFTAVEGANSVVVRATDSAGNVASRTFSFVLDTVVAQPTVALLVDSTDGAPGHDTDLASSNAALAVSALEAGATRTFKVDAGAASATYTAPTGQGAHTVVVTDTDAAGNSANRSFSFTLDTLADPEGDLKVTVGDNLVNLAERSAVAYTVSGLNADANATVTFGDGISTVTGSNGVANLTSLKDGPITVTVSAKDFAGNNASGTGAALTLDTKITAPSLALAVDSTDGAAGHDSDGRSNNAALVFSTKDADATRVVLVDGQPTASYNPAALTDGAHTVSVTDTDTAGNSAQASFFFMLDRTVATPTVSLFNDTGDQGAGHSIDRRTSDGSLIISALESDASQRVITVDGKAVANYDQAALSEGLHTIVVTDTDHAGNSASSNAFQFTIDRSIAKGTVALANDTSDGAPGHNADRRTSDASLTISALESDASQRVFVVDGKAVSSYDPAALAEGQHTVVVTDTDHAGNTVGSEALQFTIDRSIAKATIALANDTSDGATAHDADRRTSDATLTISALEGDASQRVLVVDGKAVSSYDPAALAEGQHTVVVTDTDHAGNTVSSEVLQFTVDRSIAKATVALANDTSDGATGHNTDRRTSDATLAISALENDASQRVFVVDGKAVSSYDPAALAEGQHTVIVTDTDHAGNTVSSEALQFTVDRSIAQATVALANDTSDGATGHNADRRTSDATLAISALENDASQRVIMVDGKAVTSYDPAALSEGVHTVLVTDTDHAGNTVSSEVLQFIVDRSITKATVALLNDTSDGATGHNADRRTSDATLTISALESDASQRVFVVDGKAVSSYDPATLAEGQHTVVVTDTDHAGNTVSSEALQFTIDRTIAKATVALANDTSDGATGHNADRRTSDATLTISALESDASQRVIVVDGKAVTSYDPAALSEGLHTVVVTDTDHAGNTAISEALQFTIDRSIAKATVALANDTSDGGAGHDADRRTSDASLTISALEGDASQRVVVVDGKAVTSYDPAALSEGVHTVVVTDTDHAGNTVSSEALQFTIDRSIAKATFALANDTSDGGAGHNADRRTSDASLAISALESDASQRVFVVDGKTATSYDAASLAEGQHTVVVMDTDHAGNTVSSETLQFTIDRSIAKATVALTNDTSDGGAGNEVDRRTNDATLTISALEIDASLRTITVDGKQVGSYNQGALGDGQHTVVVTDADHAGNTISSESFDFTVDRTITAASIHLLADSTDGAPGHASDKLTNNAALVFSTLDQDASRSYKVDGQAVAAYDPASLLDGKHTVEISDIDAAGNTSSSSFTFTLDTEITAPTLDLATDSSNGLPGHADDKVTNNGAIHFSAKDLDANRQILVDGTATAAYNPATLADGKHTVKVIDTDAAGNSKSATLEFTLDTKAPSAPGLALASDTSDGGVGHNSDKVTSNAAINFSALEAGATRSYSVNGEPAASTYTAPASDGNYTIAVTDTDLAGNATTSNFSFTLDTQADNGNDLKVLVADQLVNKAERSAVAYSIQGLDADANAKVAITDGSTTVFGSAGLVDLSTLVDGTIAVSILATDFAGNTVSGAAASLVLDSTAPVFTSSATASVAENAGANFAVYAAQASDVHGAQYSLLANNNDDAAAFTIGADGSVRMNAGADFETKSSYRFTVLAMDSAGNASQKAVTLAVTDVNEAPDTAPIALNTVENASIVIPVVPDYAFDVDAGDVLTVSSVSSVTLTWAPETTSNAIINPVTKQQLTLGQVYATAAISSDGKSIAISPSAEFDWATTGQKVIATVSYSVKDKEGLVTQGTVSLAIWGSTADKGKNWTGTNGADTMAGVADNENVLQGGNGNDNLTGGSVTDALYGGNGDDRLNGGAGIDYIYGDSGNDTLDGGSERDILFGGKGNDIMNGGSGGDYFVFEPQLGNDRIVGLNFSEGDRLFFLDFFANPMSVHDFVVKYAKTVGADTVISLPGGSVTLVGVTGMQALEGAISFSMPT